MSPTDDERVARFRVLRHQGGDSSHDDDDVAIEEPLELRIDGVPMLVTMRTPGDDVDLAVGLLVTEGIARSVHDVGGVTPCPGPDGASNVVRAVSAPGRTLVVPAARAHAASSACGLCGKQRIEDVRARIPRLDDPVRVARRVIAGMPLALRAAQRGFDATGGLHAAGLFDARGALSLVREDVGRHNAVDKVIGALARRAAVEGAELLDGEGRLHARGHVLFVSGRVGFEIVQKAAVARIPVIAAVSAPSSLAIELAEEVGVTLLGFVRGEAMNAYTHAWRIEDA